MGRVIFIGAGPGAADLITVRGAQRLAQADVVLFDALTDPALRVYAPKARWIDVGKRGFADARRAGAPAYDSTKQDAINALLVRHAHDAQMPSPALTNSGTALRTSSSAVPGGFANSGWRSSTSPW